MRVLGEIIAAAAVTLSITSCADIQSFQAKPRNLCLGDAVSVTWDATGNVVLAATPHLPNEGHKSPSGSEQFNPTLDTRFTLIVNSLFSSKTAEADVAVIPSALEFGGLATCLFSDHSIIVSVSLTDSQVAPTLKVQSVTNMNRRQVEITKGNIQATVSAGESVSEFANQQVTGVWRLSFPLLNNETCDEALQSITSRLTFKIAFSCGE